MVRIQDRWLRLKTLDVRYFQCIDTSHLSSSMPFFLLISRENYSFYSTAQNFLILKSAIGFGADCVMEVEYGNVVLEFISARKQRQSKVYRINQGSTWADIKKFAIDEFCLAGNIVLTDSNGIDITIHDLHTAISRGVDRSVLVQSEGRIGTIKALKFDSIW
jgi:hypothetical protein